MTKPIAYTALIAALIGGGSLNAHHSYGDVLRDQSVSVQGTLESFVFANPHVMLTVKTENSGSYTAEWQNINQLARLGITAATLKVGDRVVVTGSPTRDSKPQLKLLTEVRRSTDGWLWSVPLGSRGGPQLPAGSISSRIVK